MIRASIIVVVYNSQPYLAASLGSICADLGPHDELIVVDNSSTDGSAALVREYFPQAQLLVGPNGGYAGGNNRGAAHACGAFLVFLNPDTRIEPGAIDGLIKPLADPAVGLTTACLVHMSQPELVNACGNTVHISGLTYCRGADQPRSAFALACDVDAVSGAACAIRSELFAQLDGFDQRFFMYMEDTDLSLRARLAGYSCRYTPEAVVAHDYAMNMSPRKAFYLDRNRHLLLLKNLSGPSYRRALPALLLGELLTAGFHLLKGPRYWLVKPHVYAWLLANWDHVRAARTQAKAQQPSAEEALLRGLSHRLDFGQLMSRPLARLAGWLFHPPFRMAHLLLSGGRQ